MSDVLILCFYFVMFVSMCKDVDFKVTSKIGAQLVSTKLFIYLAIMSGRLVFLYLFLKHLILLLKNGVVFCCEMIFTTVEHGSEMAASKFVTVINEYLIVLMNAMGF